MLTTDQKNLLLKEVFLAFKNQKGLSFSPADFKVLIDKPNQRSLCSIYIISNRTDDGFKIKLYVTGFHSYTNIGNFIKTQEQNKDNGLNDEIFVVEGMLSKFDFKTFEIYLASPTFQQEVIAATDRIRLEDGSGFIRLESRTGYLLQEI